MYRDVEKLTHRPANQPRDDMAVIGETLYVNNNRPEYKSILDRIHNKVIVEDCEQKKLISEGWVCFKLHLCSNLRMAISRRKIDGATL